MGLLRGMARTAVVAGTATAVSNRVSRRQAARWERQAYEQAPPYGAPGYGAQPPPQQTYAAPAPAPPPAPEADPMTAELERLASLHGQGLLTDEEFAAAKRKLLGI